MNSAEPVAESIGDIEGQVKPGATVSSGALPRIVVMIVAIAILVGAYWPGLDGPFLFDDHGNILRNPGVRMQELSWEYVREAGLSTYGQLTIQRPLARISYALNYYFADKQFDQLHFKSTNLTIHVVNGLLLWYLMTLLLRALRLRGDAHAVAINREPLWNWFPVVVAVVWMLHPIQLTSILYVVQRMTSMAGTGVLVGVALFTYGRLRLEQARSRGMTTMVLGVGFGTILGVASKENAILTPLFAGLIELFFFNRQTLQASARRKLRNLYVLVFGFMAAAVLLIAVNSFHHIMSSYEIRNFTPLERLMTQPRVLFYYLSMILFPNVREFALFHDDFSVSTSLFDPWTTIVAVVCLLAMAALAIRSVRTASLLGFGVLWFLIGHLVESSIMGLEIIHEHRNYVPSLGPIVAVCFGVFVLVTRRREQIRAIVALGLCAVAALSFVTHTRASAWDSRAGILFFTVRNHPDSYRGHMGYGALLQAKSHDIYVVYSEYQKAAALNKYNVMPVARMQRILSGLLHQFDEGSLSEEPVPATTEELDLFHSPLVLNRAYVERLDELLDENISHRVSSYALDAESSLAMNEMRKCIVSEFHTCPPTERVERWLNLILDREQLPAPQRMAFLVTLARIAAHKGDLDASVSMMEQALGLTENDAGILIEMALVNSSLGELERAWEMLDRIEPVVEKTGRGLRNFRELKVFLQEQIEQAAAEPELAEELIPQ